MEHSQDRFQEVKKSDEVENFLTSTPGWFWMSGNYLILGFLFIFLFLSWIIKYPEVIPLELSLTPTVPPVSVHSRNSGNIILFCPEGEMVHLGQNIGYINSNADYADIQILKNKMGEIVFDSLIGNPNLLFLNRSFLLGEIEPFYQDFIQKVNEYKIQFNEKPVYHLSRSVKHQINRTSILIEKRRSKGEDYKRQLELAEVSYNRYNGLYKKGVISKMDLETEERSFLDAKHLFGDNRIVIDQTNIQLIELNEQLRKLNLEIHQEMEILIKEMHDNLNLLIGAIKEWERNYLIKAPINGKLYYTKVWSSNQYIQSDEEVAVIAPVEKSTIVGKGLMPIYNSGKVKKGQEVVVRLGNYNYAEYGALIGKVQDISPVSRNNKYLVTVYFPSHAISTYGNKIDLDKELSGEGSIITEDLILLERYFYQVRGLFKNNN